MSDALSALERAELPPPARRVFCNRTLNFRGIEAIGFDMDYTLVHYHVHVWEQRAYEHLKRRLVARGFPIEHLEFDPDIAALGLILDVPRGNLVKANRFGYVKRAAHGTRIMSFEDQRAAYERTVVDLADARWVFLNTLFSLSEACMFAQLVDLLDDGKLHVQRLSSPGVDPADPAGEGVMSYLQLYEVVRRSLDATHMEGELKAEIIAAPEQYVQLDEELPLALKDLRAAGKKLVIITNSEWHYTQAMMSYAFDRYMPDGQTWRDLFDLVIVAARKPAFFTERMPAFEVLDEAGRLFPVQGKLQLGKAYLGGNARLVESSLGIPGESLLFVGDHIFADVNVSKSVNRWRTCLVLRDLEGELEALESFKPVQRELSARMHDKELLEHRYSQMRIALQRLEHGYGPVPQGVTIGSLRARMRELRAELVALDERIGPLARKSGELVSPRWGLLLRTGNDKSHLARQIERHADVYTSRVSNFLYSTPFVYLRSPRGSLPHDSGPEGGVED
ncbi:HAD-IG family 5'-nucleotidase [Sandaracinus amylolyticus]|uniref:HAD superfamily (Subfamily IG) hydrolase, 5'-nucleotidase n=1 Tax=Sandaracinus amylolyticus TaxID=927083 RepID=A0A0F6W7S0_9BACT|nr:HAD-IG family 5'-nucleotidase [Sandaracinus amylolyticus]AKF09586.1 HAD superfamily (Subfamily IG) hydrolase, 5'-nucleotidase [Sandaracinus amylolyticus]